MNQPREDLPRLASYVVDARIAAGFSTRKEFADATGVTARTLGKLETASERVSNETLARVARELRWTPDSPARVMAGQEPVPVGRDDAARPDTPPPGASVTSEAARLLFPDDYRKQVIWSLPATSEEDRADMIAILDGRRRGRSGGEDSLRKGTA